MLERLDAAYQHASRFSADAAHELRTPISIMRGELELLAGQKGLAPETQGAIGSILEEAARLSQIVGNLMALSYLDGVAGKRAHIPLDLFALAAETIEHMRLVAEEKGIIIEGPVGRVAVTAGDRGRLKQVLVNLLDNAIKYTQPGGRIRVAVSAGGGTAFLRVSDTGIGIAGEHLPHIFDRFFRVSTDRGEIGAGLGLAIVRSICAAHGGRVTVDSTLGSGSTFTVELPEASGDVLAASSGASGPAVRAPAEID
jgi:signal transduction histidine kinase